MESKVSFKNLRIKKNLVSIYPKDKKVIETIPGYAHSIKNIGKDIAQGMVWANET